MFSGSGEERVYSDSVFWMNPRVYRSLVEWYEENMSTCHELDAYAHFLPCFGERVQEVPQTDGTDDGLQNCSYSNQMKSILSSFSFSVIILEESRFYHLGSIREYIDNYTRVEQFQTEMGIANSLCNFGSQPSSSNLVRNSGNLIVGSRFEHRNSVSQTSVYKNHIVIEWSHIGVAINVADNTIISNCVINPCATIKFLTSFLHIFPNCLYHTVPFKDKQHSNFYVTFILNMDDSIKQSSSDLDAVTYFGLSMLDILLILNFKKSNVIASEPFSLWNIRLFPRAQTAAQSFWRSHNMINKLLKEKEGTEMETEILEEDDHLYSLQDIVELKDLDTLLKDRDELICNILNAS